MSVRWRPLLSAHSRKRRTSDKRLTQSFDVLRSSKWRLSSWTFSFCGRRCLSAVSHPQQYSIVTRDTVVPMNIEVPTKYPLIHNDRFVVLETRLHSESPMLYRPALHGNWNALSLARRALKDKFPTPKIHSQLRCQIVRYFCLTLYYINRPASWSSGQGLWLLIMKSRFRFPVLPWEFFLAGKDSRGDHGLGS